MHTCIMTRQAQTRIENGRQLATYEECDGAEHQGEAGAYEWRLEAPSRGQKSASERAECTDTDPYKPGSCNDPAEEWIRCEPLTCRATNNAHNIGCAADHRQH